MKKIQKPQAPVGFGKPHTLIAGRLKDQASPSASEMGNRDAIGEWLDPVVNSNPATSSEGSAEPRTDPAKMSEEELNRLSPGLTEARERERVIWLSHSIKLPPGLLSQTALQLKALEPREDLIGELFPR